MRGTGRYPDPYNKLIYGNTFSPESGIIDCVLTADTCCLHSKRGSERKRQVPYMYTMYVGYSM